MTEKEYKELTRRLPIRIKEKINRKMLTKEFLETEIAQAKRDMKTDIYFGIPWVICYTFSLFMFGLAAGTIGIFCLGAAYFLYVTYKRGNYGMLKRKVEVYEDILGKI